MSSVRAVIWLWLEGGRQTDGCSCLAARPSQSLVNATSARDVREGPGKPKLHLAPTISIASEAVDMPISFVQPATKAIESLNPTCRSLVHEHSSISATPQVSKCRYFHIEIPSSFR